MADAPTILRAKFPKPQPRDSRSSSTASSGFRYPASSYQDQLPSVKWRPAFDEDHLDQVYGPEQSDYDLVTVFASDAKGTKKTFRSAPFSRSPEADAYAAQLRKQGLKVCWHRVPGAKPSDLAQVRSRLAQVASPDPKKTEKSTGIPGYMLRKPCKHCPFAPTDTRITFSGPERAMEIAESAYRDGFPCHESATLHEDEDGERNGFVFGAKTQHCAGAAMMFLQQGSSRAWPGIGNDQELADKLVEALDWDAPHYKCEANFVRANTRRR